MNPSNPPQSTPTIRLPMLGHQLNPNHHQQQQQHQGLNPNHQQQQPNHNQQGPTQPPPPQSGQDFTLSSVLHFLQTEWRRYERDRNEWEIERAEMRARIALLEGERRSFENIRLDLARRIKMLEYALRMERTKQLNQQSATSSAKANVTQPQVSQKEDTQPPPKDGSGSSSPRSDDSPLPDHGSLGSMPNGAPPSGGRPQTWGGVSSAPTNPAALAGIGKPPPGRDPRSRQRSKDYLKQCLQEITYLTSTQALNPLPNRPLLSNSSLPVSIPNLPPFDQSAYNGRPRKVVPDTGNLPIAGPGLMGKNPPETNKDFPSMNGTNLSTAPPSATIAAPVQLDRGAASHQQPPPPLPQHLPPQEAHQIQLLPQQLQDDKTPDRLESEQVPLSDNEPSQLTAIFRPDEAGEWREQLKAMRQASQNAHPRSLDDTSVSHDHHPNVVATGAASWDGRQPEDEDDSKADEDDGEAEEVNVTGEGNGGKVWRARRTLRNHLDAVRAIAFHAQDMSLATGGDDCTVKIWRIDAASLAPSASGAKTEIEPQLTLRGHSSPITRLVYSTSRHLLYSASLDSTIHVWRLPGPNHTTYAAFDSSRSKGVLVGHTDAVWDLALVRDESVLVSCGADGAVKVWDVGLTASAGALRLSWGYGGLGADDGTNEKTEEPLGAAAVEALKTDLKRIAVAYRNAVVKIFDIDTGKEVGRLQSDMSYDGTPASQINKLASHPTMPLLVTAHEDKYIRLFDITTGQCTHSMLAHLDSVTTLAIDPAGFSLVSGGHDCSVRFWDLLNSRACVQETTSHREKAREGVLDVAFHPSLPFLASAGADGVVKLYASS
ncbi:WD40 repeat-like protein [Ramaria rubella]|nr:WD40 repeat-like protein [Ramaria rubella]KAF8589923.1 WD40 repeat-like protein [Ramaria rubella]